MTAMPRSNCNEAGTAYTGLIIHVKYEISPTLRPEALRIITDRKPFPFGQLGALMTRQAKGFQGKIIEEDVEPKYRQGREVWKRSERVRAYTTAPHNSQFLGLSCVPISYSRNWC